jgi:CHAT domain-containing protein
LQAELVTLSACQTGFSDVNPGDEIAGLSRSLFYAGAQAVLLTLWSVRADTTLEWMLDFYRRVWTPQGTPRCSKVLAFQQAVLALRKKYPDNPAIWAPFILMGNAL